jgi:hypothetical protein
MRLYLEQRNPTEKKSVRSDRWLHFRSRRHWARLAAALRCSRLGPPGRKVATPNTIANMVARMGLKNSSDFIFCSFVNLVFLVLAFVGSWLLSCHFFPFADVLGRIRRFVTRKVWKTARISCLRTSVRCGRHGCYEPKLQRQPWFPPPRLRRGLDEESTTLGQRN